MGNSKTKIDLIEDADATGEIAKVYDEWQSPAGFPARGHELQQHGSFLRGPSDPPHEGSHRQLGLSLKPLPLLTGLTCLLPAGSGSG